MRTIATLLIVIGTTLPAVAADGFNIVIPGRPGVPIIINGADIQTSLDEAATRSNASHVSHACCRAWKTPNRATSSAPTFATPMVSP